MDTTFLGVWLDESIQHHPLVDYVLLNTTLSPTLHVQRVKTYKNKVAMKRPPPARLLSDLQTKLL